MHPLRSLQQINVAMERDRDPSDEDDVRDSPQVQSGRRISSNELFADSREVFIEHSGVTYRLRITRAGKLILTK